MMNIFVIDTSIENGYVALVLNNTIIDKKHFPSKGQSKFILPYIEQILKENNLSLENIHLIGVCIGPGSFTGVRVGVMIAKSLAYGANIPIIGFNSFIPYPRTQHITVIPSKIDYGYISKDNELSFTPLSTLKNEKNPISTPSKEKISAYIPHSLINSVSYSIERIIDFLKSEFKNISNTNNTDIEVIYLQPL